MVLTNRCQKDDPGVVYLKRDPKVPESTNLYLAPGVELVGAATEKALGLYNAAFLTVVRVYPFHGEDEDELCFLAGVQQAIVSTQQR